VACDASDPGLDPVAEESADSLDREVKVSEWIEIGVRLELSKFESDPNYRYCAPELTVSTTASSRRAPSQ
jgi:hypothetical protein